MKVPSLLTTTVDSDNCSTCDLDRTRQTSPKGPELLSRTDLQTLGIRASNPTLLVWEADGKFPKRLAISPAKVAWLRAEVVAWIDAKAAARG